MRLIEQIKPNTVAIVTSEISNSARLPLRVCRGSVAQRDNLASQYSAKFMQEIDKVSDKKTCSPDGFITALNNTLGENSIGFGVIPLENPLYAGSLERVCDIDSKVNSVGGVLVEDTFSTIAGYNFHFPVKKEGKLNINKSTAVHESRHLFDYICNPKTINFPSFYIIHKEERLKDFHSVYNDFVENCYPYTTMKSFKKYMAKQINKMPREDAIAVLQCSRNSMKSELNSYNDELKYLKQNPLKNLSSIYEIHKFLFFMKYKDKISFANEMLKTKLKEARLSNNKG